MGLPIGLDFVRQILRLFFKRIFAQELDNLRNLCQRRPHFISLPKIYRCIVNMKLEGKLALGELQIQPSGLDPIAPRPADIRVFLPVDRFLGP